MQSVCEDMITTKFEQNEWTPLSGQTSAPEPTEELLEPLPPAPSMNVCVIDSDTGKLQLPIEICKKWQFNPNSKEDFGKFLDEFCAKHEVVDVKENKKKRSGGDQEDTPPKKKNSKEVASVKTIDVSEITSALVFEAELKAPVKHGGFLQLRFGSQIYIINKGTAESTFDQGTYVCGWGKGVFKQCKTEGDKKPDFIQFALNTSSDKVILNNVVKTIGEVIEDQQKEKPDCKINYHTIELDQDNWPHGRCGHIYRCMCIYR